MSTLKTALTDPFRVGNFDVEPARNTVFLNGETFRLEPRIMEVLCLLAENAGDVVLRETIIDQLWGLEHGADESVTRSISVLRKTFREAGDDAVYIETVPKRGYRLAAEVSVSSPQAPKPQVVPAEKAAPGAQQQGNTGTIRKYAAIAAGLLFVLFAGAQLFKLDWSARPGAPGVSAKDEQELLREKLASIAKSSGDADVDVDSARVAHREEAAYRIIEQDPETAIAVARNGAEAGLEVLKKRAQSKTGTRLQDWMNLGELTFENYPQVSLAAYRAAAEIDPGQHETWFRLSKLEEEQAGDLTAAMTAALNAERVAKTLLNRLVGLERIASLEAEAGDVASAKKRFEQIVTLNRQQLQKDETNSIWLQELSIALDGLGSMEMRLGDIDAARKTYTEVLALDRQRAEADPSDWDNRRDISISLENLGVLELIAGNFEAAKTAFEESMIIDRRNLQERPDSLMVSRDLASSLSRVSEINLALGNADTALSASMEAEQITRLNLAKNPDSAFLKEDLVKCLKNTGKAYVALNQPEPAHNNFRDALAIAKDLLSDDTLDVSVRKELADVLSSIAAVSGDPAYKAEAEFFLGQLTPEE